LQPPSQAAPTPCAQVPAPPADIDCGGLRTVIFHPHGAAKKHRQFLSLVDLDARTARLRHEQFVSHIR